MGFTPPIIKQNLCEEYLIAFDNEVIKYNYRMYWSYAIAGIWMRNQQFQVLVIRCRDLHNLYLRSLHQFRNNGREYGRLKIVLPFFSNNFEGARLNGVVNDSIDKYTILISSENIPINPSPWYAFTVWSNNPRKITINFTYQDSRSRYYPKVSRDGVNFKPLDSVDFQPVNPGEGDHGIDAVPEGISIKINVDENPVWISAQELYTSSRIRQWVDELGQSDFCGCGLRWI